MTIENALISQSVKAAISKHVAEQYEALEAAIKSLELMISKQPVELHSGLDRNIHLRECRTVIAGSGRQNGKSHWIATHARRGDLILCIGIPDWNFFENKFDDLNIDYADRPMVVTLRELSIVYDVEAEAFRNVYVDDAYYVFSKIQRNKFYRQIEHRCSDKTMFYLIG